MNIRSFARRALLSLVTAIGLCTAQIASATIVVLDPTGFKVPPAQVFDVTGEPFSPVQVGAFTGLLDGNPLTFFCFELTQTFGFNPPAPYYTYDDSVMSGGKYDALSELFTEGFSTALATPGSSAAFQLAVWEILMEATPGSVSLNQGSFYVTNDHGNPGTVTAANVLLAGLPSTGVYTIHLLRNEANQDFVYGTLPLRQVPEPAPLMLIGAAMIALFAMRRMVAKRAA